MKLNSKLAVTQIAVVIAVLTAGMASADGGEPLHGITIASEFDRISCNREVNFQNGSERWSDGDDDGEDTRQEVLAAESWIPVMRDAKGTVVEGLWVSPYAGFVTRDPGELDIDHVVAVCEAWRSGAHGWEQERRVEFANSLVEDHHLVAAWSSTNRSKLDRDPAKWLPPNRAYWCTYLKDWTAIKHKWGLTMDPMEAAAVREGLHICGRYAKSDRLAGHH